MIDAQFRSEEKYAKLSLSYEGSEEKEKVHACVEKIIASSSLQPETYTSPISGDKEVLVIEYHDDPDREAGGLFEEMIKVLEITDCN